MRKKLKRCPFCKGEMIPVVLKGGDIFAEHKNPGNAVTCLAASSLSLDEFIDLYNTRPLEDALRRRAEAAEKELEAVKAELEALRNSDEMINTRMHDTLLSASDVVQAEKLAEFRAELEDLKDANKKVVNNVMEIIAAALSGDNERYLYSDANGTRYCRWGVVEKDIRALSEKPEANR